MYRDLRCPVPGGLVMSEEGREEREGNLNFPQRPALWTIRLQQDLGPEPRASGPRLQSLQPMGSRLGGRSWGWATLRRNPHARRGSQSEQQLSVSSPRFSEQEEEVPRRKRSICTEKRSRPAIPLSPLRFTVDNLSWPLRSWELCSGALGQDHGLHPPSGRRHRTGAARPSHSAMRQAGVPGRVALSALGGDRGRRGLASGTPDPSRL